MRHKNSRLQIQRPIDINTMIVLSQMCAEMLCILMPFYVISRICCDDRAEVSAACLQGFWFSNVIIFQVHSCMKACHQSFGKCLCNCHTTGWHTVLGHITPLRQASTNKKSLVMSQQSESYQEQIFKDLEAHQHNYFLLDYCEVVNLPWAVTSCGSIIYLCAFHHA